jgi:LysR family transcriptional regulator, glycine cleavage system transcriptional activator
VGLFLRIHYFRSHFDLSAEIDSFIAINQTRMILQSREWNSCMRRYRTVPPLQFLLGFEAAARLGSFSKAAVELGLSQSAISHEMRLLEARLGQPLFLRVGRSVQLTDGGRVYQRVVQDALESLDAAQQKLEPFRRQSSVVIYAPRDFARLWIMPRLPSLLLSCPDVQPWLDSSGAPVDFASMEISIGIVYAEEPPTELLSMKLANDTRVPVARHGLLKTAPLSLEALATAPLIHDEKLPGWLQFFSAQGYNSLLPNSVLDFSDSDAALSAAEAGLGIVLAAQVLVANPLAAGRLHIVSDFCYDTGRNWFAVTTKVELANPHTLAVWNWLSEAVR